MKTSGSASGAGGSRTTVDLSSALNAESVNNIVCNAKKTDSLMVHLPTIETSENAKKQLKDTFLSAQFQQALSMFSSALQSGQLGPVVSQFQLSQEAVAAANSGDLEQFVKALEKSSGTTAAAAAAAAATVDKKSTSEDTPMEEDKNGDPA